MRHSDGPLKDGSSTLNARGNDRSKSTIGLIASGEADWEKSRALLMKIVGRPLNAGEERRAKRGIMIPLKHSYIAALVALGTLTLQAADQSSATPHRPF